jgi:hypothetical protein
MFSSSHRRGQREEGDGVPRPQGRRRQGNNSRATCLPRCSSHFSFRDHRCPTGIPCRAGHSTSEFHSEREIECMGSCTTCRPTRLCACARDDGFCSPPLFWKQKVAAFHGGKAKEKTCCLPLPSVLRPQAHSLVTAASTKLPASCLVILLLLLP